MINVAFEISPLLLASGSFGDKSGVYRYYYGLIKAYGEYLKKNRIDSRVILFSFNRDLLNLPVNREILELLDNKVFLLLNRFPEPKSIDFDSLKVVTFIFKPFLKILNLIFPMKKAYAYLIDNLRFKSYLKLLIKEFKKNKVSIVYHSETCFYPIGGFKSVLTVYDLTPITMYYFHRSETNDLSQRKLYFARRHCKGLVCISQSTKNDLLKHCLLQKNTNITICYPGLDQSFLAKRNDLFNDIKRIVSEKTDVLKKNRYIFFYSTFEPRKNIFNLIQVFSDLCKDRQTPNDFKLVLMGGEGWGKVKQKATNFIKENFPIKDKNRIIILDYLSDDYLISLIKNAYAVIYPSFYEGFGLPVLESMALGTPVLTSNNSSLAEVGGDAVLYCNPHDYYDLKNKIKYLVDNPKQIVKLKQLGLRQAKKFNWNQSAKKLHQFFQELSS